MIYFTKNGISDNGIGAYAALLPPSIEYKSGELCHAKENGTAYTVGSLHISDSAKHIGEGRYVITRKIKNASECAVEFKDILRVKDLFSAKKYLIPCILYNGNEHGSSNTPKSLIIDGENWIFSYDRMGIPSCTLTENAEVGVSLFASAKDGLSLESSCSLMAADDGYEHRIYHPVTEAPYSYSSKNVMTGRYDTYLTLEGGESVEIESYLLVCTPKYENYACADLIEAALELLAPENEPSLSPDEVFDLGISYANALLYTYKGKKMIITHYAQRLFRYQHMVKITLDEMAEMMRDPYYTELGAFDERFEMGWADQNLLNARMLALDAIEKNDSAMLDTAIGVFDAFCETQKENGLCYTLYEQNFDENAYENATPDACNLGWGACEMIRMYRLLSEHGIDKSEYVSFARKVCDFFIDSYNDSYGYGKSYHMDGSVAQTQGSIGGFMIVAMLECYKQTADKRYLDNAVTASDFTTSATLTISYVPQVRLTARQ